MVARELLNLSHPLHKSLIAWMAKRQGKDVTEPTVRSARKFLAAHPQYMVVQKAA